MKKLKVVTVVGTRPEIIRLSCILPQLDKFFEHTLIHTGQNYDYELNEIFFEDMELREPDHILDSAGKSGADTIGKVIISVDKVLADIKPDALLVLGDTNSCLSVLAAKRRKIPTFHMEAGNRCFDMRVPEEINRRIVDHTADINLTYSSIAREYLLAEGIPAEMVIKTGSPMYEVLSKYKHKISSSSVLKKLNLKEREYFLVSVHREENIDSISNFKNFVSSLNEIAKNFKLPIIVSTHPRTQKKIKDSNVKFNKLVNLLPPLSFTDYNKLQICSKTTLSDSGTINEESSILGFHALNLREAHERPEGMEEAAVMMVGLNSDRILQALKILNLEKNQGVEKVYDYSMPNVSQKIVRIILSYTDFVNRVVWKKY